MVASSTYIDMVASNALTCLAQMVDSDVIQLEIVLTFVVF